MKEYSNFAFISYSHKDEKWAAWIQEKLEAYRLPSIIRKEAGSTVPERIAPVFRDATDLAAGRLRNNLQEELEASKFLIVVCSPNSAKPNAEGKHWVNDEVAHFAAMGREDRILPVIVGGTSEKDAFCPKLAELGLLAIDATKKSRPRTLNDIVAFLLGLRPDELWNREERIRKAKRRVAAGFAAVGILLLAAAVYCWYDMCGLHVEHYADYVDHWGIPVGIPSTRLNVRQVANRTMSFRFEYRGRERFLSGKRILRRVVKVNSLDVPVFDDELSIVDAYFAKRPVIQVFHYKEDKSATEFWQALDFVDDQDRHGKTELRHKFSGTKKTDVEHVRPLEAGEVDSHLLADATSNAARPDAYGLPDDSLTRCEIRRYKLTRNKTGVVEKVEFFKDRSLRVKDADGIYGCLNKLDREGRVEKQTYLGYMGKEPHPNKFGIAGKVREFDLCGNLSRVSYVDKYGRQILNVSEKIASKRYRHDEFGNCVKVEYLSAEGMPTRGKEGAAIKRAEIEKGKVVRICAMDEDNCLVLTTQGWAAIALSYSRSGDLAEMWYLNKDGARSFALEGYAGVRKQFVDHDEVSCEYLGVDGEPTMSKNGYAKTSFDYENHRLCRVVCHDVNGDPARSAELGAYGVAVEYDADGLAIDMVLLGADGEPANGPDGWAEIKFEYADGFPVATRKFDSQGRLCAGADGIAGWNSEFENGNEVVRTFIGADGSPVLHRDGCAGWRQVFENGLLTAYRFLDQDGKIIANKEGIAGYNYLYDESGRRIRFENVDASGSLVCSPADDLAGFESSYDVNGNVVKQTYFGADGRPCLSDGTAGWVAEYNERGLMTLFGFVGLDGHSAISLKTGVATTKYEYDAFGNVARESYFGPNGAPCFNTEQGAASRSVSYDSLGRETEQFLYGTDGKLTVFPGSNVAGGRTAYDVYGHVCLMTFVGANGLPVVSSVGYASEKSVYDSRGDLVEQYWLDADGKLLVVPEKGAAGCRCSYDQFGRLTELVWIGADGNPHRHLDGNAGWRKKYDALGNVLEFVYLDEHGNLFTNRKDGTAGVRSKYDKKGNETEREFIAPDGKVVKSFDGYARESAEYDNFGNVTCWRCFDEHGRPCLVADGTAGWRAVFSNGKEVERTSLGLDGAPCISTNGYATVTHVYDAAGREIVRRYLDENGHPVAMHSGEAECRSEYNGRGQLNRVSYFDVAGRPVETFSGQSVVYAYDSRGNEIERTYLKSEGKPFADTNGVARVAKYYDERNLLVRESYFGVNGLPVARSDYGLVSKGWIYDESGNVTEVRTLDAEGGLVVSSKGFAIMRYIRDALGRVSGTRTFDAAGKMTCVPEFGVAGHDSDYDVVGNEVERRYVGSDGRAARYAEGYSVWRAAYDDRKCMTRIEYLNEMSQPCVSTNGVAGYQYKYGAFDRLAQVECLGADGKPTVCNEGYAVRKLTYDRYGRVASERNYDVAGKPCALPSTGCFGWNAEYDRLGKETSRTWIGVDGKPCACKKAKDKKKETK